MKRRFPKNTPAIGEMLANIEGATPERVAEALDVSPRTVRRWMTHGAPRVALLALWPLTSWAQDEADKMTHALVCNLRGMIEAYQRENAALRAQLVKLGRVGQFGAANDPSPLVPCVRPNANPPTRASHASRSSPSVMPRADVSAG